MCKPYLPKDLAYLDKASQIFCSTYAYLWMGSFLPHIFLAYCILSYCVVFYACSSAMALKRVAHTRGNNVCFRYGDRTLVRPFLMPLGTSRLQATGIVHTWRKITTLFFSITLVYLFVMAVVPQEVSSSETNVFINFLHKCIDVHTKNNKILSRKKGTTCLRIQS